MVPAAQWQSAGEIGDERGSNPLHPTLNVRKVIINIGIYETEETSSVNRKSKFLPSRATCECRARQTGKETGSREVQDLITHNLPCNAKKNEFFNIMNKSANAKRSRG